MLEHLGLAHRDLVGSYLARMHTTANVAPIAAETYELVEGGTH